AASAVTWAAGVIGAPATVLVGFWVKMSCVAVPGVMSNAVLVTGANPLALAANVYPVPVLFRLRSENVATPPTAATGVVPLSVLPPGSLPSATLTLPVNPDTRFPSASTARTFTAGLIWWPATVGLGSVL